MKGQKDKRNKVRKVLLLICICIMAFSAFQIGKILYGYVKDRTTYSDIKAHVKTEENVIDQKKLNAINDDIIGWIVCEDTIVDYPILKGHDNDYYLYRNAKGEYAGAGSIFMDFRNNKYFKDFATIIYGHHMKDGSMFNVIDDYQDPGFYKKHPEWTIYGKKADYTLQIFAGFVVKSNDDLYYIDEINQLDEEGRSGLIDRFYAESDFQSKVKVNDDDKIVILSTCYPREENDRYVLIGKLEKQSKH